MIRTGVIVGMTEEITEARTVDILEHLQDRFPSVTFALVAGAVNTIAFPYEDGTTTEDPRPHDFIHHDHQ